MRRLEIAPADRDPDSVSVDSTERTNPLSRPRPIDRYGAEVGAPTGVPFPLTVGAADKSRRV